MFRLIEYGITSTTLFSRSIEYRIKLAYPHSMLCGQADDDAASAYQDAVDRFLGKKVDLRFLTPKPVGLVSRLLSSLLVFVLALL